MDYIKKIRVHIGAFLVKYKEASLPTPIIKEQVVKKFKLGVKPQPSVQEITNLVKSYILNKK